MVKIIYLFALSMPLMASVFTENVDPIDIDSQEYFKAVQLHLLHSIEEIETKITNAEASLASRLDLINYEQQQLLHEVHQIHQNLTSLQNLSLIRKYCIQKYESQILTKNGARHKLKICHDKSKINITSLTSNARSAVNSAKSYALFDFMESVKGCSEKHNKNKDSLELCFVERVEFSKQTVGNYLRKAKDHLEKDLFESSVISHGVVRCTYKVTSEILKSLGAALLDISNCQITITEQKLLYENQGKEEKWET